MNEIQIFNNDEFGNVRTTEIDGKTYFAASDVARALGYSNPRAAISRHCKGVVKRDGVSKAVNQYGSEAIVKSEMSFIPEGDVYRLIVRSQLPSADKFEEWLFDEVVPSIRKTGGYQVPQSVPQQIQLLAQGYVDLEKKIDSVTENVETMKTDLQAMKDEMPMFPAELEQITRAARRKGIEVLGGGDSIAYHDRGLCSTVYRDIYREIHRNFGVNSYKLIRRSECGKVIGVIDGYRLPVVLAEKVAKRNTEVAA